MPHKKILSFLSSQQWVLPFIAFLGGYLFLARLMRSEQVTVPSLVGVSLAQGMKMLAAAQLTAQVLEEQHNPDVQPTTIIEQTPTSGKKVRAGQTVYLVITAAPQGAVAPSLYDAPVESLANYGSEVKIENIMLESAYPKDKICAQFPLPGTELQRDQKLITYSSCGLTSRRLLPDVRGRAVPDVIEFFKEYGVQYTLYHSKNSPEHVCSERCIVSDQRPLAGTIVDLSKPLLIHLQIS